MTEESCRLSQRECARRVTDDMTALRIEVKEDIGKIREAVQAIDRSVSQIRGYLGLNGNAADVHPHKRQQDEMEHLHRRITDLLDKAEENAASAQTKSTESITIPRWVLVPAGIFIIVVLAIAMVAGERGLVFLPKTAQTQEAAPR